MYKKCNVIAKTELRCPECNKLLAKADRFTVVEVKCTRCKTLSAFKSVAVEPSNRAPGVSEKMKDEAT